MCTMRQQVGPGQLRPSLLGRSVVVGVCVSIDPTGRNTYRIATLELWRPVRLCQKRCSGTQAYSGMALPVRLSTAWPTPKSRGCSAPFRTISRCDLLISFLYCCSVDVRLVLTFDEIILWSGIYETEAKPCNQTTARLASRGQVEAGSPIP